MLCFSLSTAPQVSTRVMAPVFAMLHDLGVRILRYLDDWFVLASSRKEALQARDVVLHLCHQLGIMVNLAKSHLDPSRTATYVGMTVENPSLRAFPSQKRVSTLQSQLDKFLSCRRQSVIAWGSLLCCLCVCLCRGSSPYAFTSAGALPPVGFQGRVRHDLLDELDLLWWSDPNHLLQGISLEVQHPDLLFWSDALD